MASKEHLALLKRGRAAWNRWREIQPEIQPDLMGADLARLNLTGANLSEVNFQDANLEKADLSGATGLVVRQLAGTNLSGAKLPNDVRTFEGLANVQEISKSAQNVFLSMLLGCVYSWLTIATTTDARLLTNSASSPLPIIQTEIPIAYFFWVAPLILLCFYGYLHLYLQRLWEALADLPAVFPDGRTLDKQAPCWPLNGLVSPHFKLLRDIRPSLSHLQVGLSILLAWWSVPLTLVFFWLKYLHRHDWSGTVLHITLLVISIWGGYMLWRLAAVTLQRKTRKAFLWKKALNDGRTYKYSAVVLGTGVVFHLLSLGAIDGVRPYGIMRGIPGPLVVSDPLRPLSGFRIDSGQTVVMGTTARDWENSGIRRWALFPFILSRYLPFADLQEADVSTKPLSWTGRNDDEIELVKGAQLHHSNLRYSMARGAFLVKSDLREANLEGADLEDADLRRANLELANLHGAILIYTNLRGANLQGTDLHKAALSATDLSRADLRLADLRDAILNSANLEMAVLDEANLQRAYLNEVKGLTLAQLQKGRHKVRNWMLASYSDDLLKELGLPPDHNERVEKKDLSGANLSEADLDGADLKGFNLQGANLEGTSLRGADLREADLTHAVGLTKGQIFQQTIRDEKTRLPDDLKMQLQPQTKQKEEQSQ